MKRGESKAERELYQYQPLPMLLEQLSAMFNSYVREPTRLADSEGGTSTKVISVYSPMGGTGKTAVALHLAHAASSYQRRTFYLNLERWNTAEAWLSMDEATTILSRIQGVKKGCQSCCIA